MNKLFARLMQKDNKTLDDIFTLQQEAAKLGLKPPYYVLINRNEFSAFLFYAVQSFAVKYGHTEYIGPLHISNDLYEAGIVGKVGDCYLVMKEKEEKTTPYADRTIEGSTMQAYIGTKVILAEPMNEVAFLSNVKKQDATGCEARPGYHVVYANPDGNDYHSWSPKDVFEAAYRPVSSDEKKLINR